MKRYLGDSVYAELDEQNVAIVLTTENDDSGPSNRIVLEAEVADGLALFFGDAQKRLEENRYRVIEDATRCPGEPS